MSLEHDHARLITLDQEVQERLAKFAEEVAAEARYRQSIIDSLTPSDKDRLETIGKMIERIIPKRDASGLCPWGANIQTKAAWIARCEELEGMAEGKERTAAITRLYQEVRAQDFSGTF